MIVDSVNFPAFCMTKYSETVTTIIQLHDKTQQMIKDTKESKYFKNIYLSQQLTHNSNKSNLLNGKKYCQTLKTTPFICKHP